MWSRSRLDIDWSDLAIAAFGTWRPGGPDPEAVAARWDPEGALFLTLRTAWDAVLAELALEPGEAVVTAVNIPDMFALLEHHGLRPVPVDLDPGTLAPEPGALAAALGDQTRLVLITHLLGCRVDMGAVHAELDAAGSAVPVIEDSAQAFFGPHERGHPRSLAALYSFGPIKSSTALGGCLARISDPTLRRSALARARAYPRQARLDYLATVAKYTALRAMSAPRAYATFVRICELSGRSHDAVINGAVLGLAGDDYWAALRRRPAPALVTMIERRLRRFEGSRLRRRRAHGEHLAARLAGVVPVLGEAADSRGWWQFAVRSPDPEALVARLRAGGFDATTGGSRLSCPAPRPGTPDSTPRASAAMAEVVYVPAYPELPERELARLADLILGVEP